MLFIIDIDSCHIHMTPLLLTIRYYIVFSLYHCHYWYIISPSAYSLAILIFLIAHTDIHYYWHWWALFSLHFIISIISLMLFAIIDHLAATRRPPFFQVLSLCHARWCHAAACLPTALRIAIIDITPLLIDREHVPLHPLIPFHWHYAIAAKQPDACCSHYRCISICAISLLILLIHYLLALSIIVRCSYS